MGLERRVKPSVGLIGKLKENVSPCPLTFSQRGDRKGTELVCQSRFTSQKGKRLTTFLGGPHR